MKRTTMLVLFALTWIMVPHSLFAQTNVAATITHLEQAWADAQKAGDAANVAPLLADKFINTDVDGNRSGKSELLSNLKGGKWEQNEISDVKVSLYGDTAIATGAWAGKGVDGDGTKVDRRERWTDTWVKMKDGKWQCVASQQTAVRK
jgi:ketosteroid isomerase-like protein